MKGRAQFSAGIVMIVVIAGIAASLVLMYNSLVKAEKITEEASAQIEVVCQRRLDLMPNLIETVKAYAKHENQTLKDVIQARNQAQDILNQVKQKTSMSQEDLVALSASQSQLMKGIRGIFALAESYPNLKASTNFYALQDQFEGTENRISVARQRYNQAARMFNTKIEVFPNVIIAPMFGFEEKAYWEAKPEAMEGFKAEF